MEIIKARSNRGGLNQMTRETVKELQGAKGKFELEVNGFGVKFKADHCNAASWLIAIYSMVNRLSEETALSDKSILGLIEELTDSVQAFECESKEQLDVMNEFYRQQLEK